MFSKKLLVSGLVCLMSVALLTSCGQDKNRDTEKKESKKEGKEITLMIPDWGAPTKEMLDEFKKESGISVKVLPTAWEDIKSKISIAAASKSAAADVIEVDWSWAGEFQNAKWLEKLDVDESTQKDIPSISYFKFDKYIYAVPYANGLRVAYMNKEMTSKAGISTTPSNWNEMLEAMNKLKRKNIVKYPFLFPLHAEEKTTTSFLTMTYTRNGIVFNKDNTLNYDSAYDTLSFIEKLIKQGYINPNSVSKPGIDTFKGINSRNGAFLLGPTSFITSSNDKKVSKVVGQITTIPMPSKKGPAKNTISFTEAVGVSAYSENKDAAKKFVEWFSKPETQLKLNKAVNNTPTRTSVLETMVKDGSIKTPGSLIEQTKLINTPFPNGVPKYYTKISTQIFNIISQMGQGKITAKEAAIEMKAKVDKFAKNDKKTEGNK